MKHKLVCFSTEDPWARSSRAAPIHQAAQPCGNGAVLRSVILLTSRSGCHRLSILLMWLCCFQCFSFHRRGRDRGSWGISLTQHWLVQVSKVSMAHLCSEVFGTVWDVLSWWRLGCMGTVSSMQSLGAWVFAVLVPFYEVTAVRGFRLCGLLKRIQSILIISVPVRWNSGALWQIGIIDGYCSSLYYP